jgi:hypothetical protein
MMMSLESAQGTRAGDSDGRTYSGGQVNGLRKRHAQLRHRLQKQGTESAQRRLTKSRRRDQRCGTDGNYGNRQTAGHESPRHRARDPPRRSAGDPGPDHGSKGARRVQHRWAFHPWRTVIACNVVWSCGPAPYLAHVFALRIGRSAQSSESSRLSVHRLWLRWACRHHRGGQHCP